MIKHLITIINNQRNSNLWILAELLLASICLWFVVDYSLVLGYIMNQPLGFDTDYTYRIDLAELTPDNDSYISSEVKTTTTGQDLLVIMERIRQHPDVEAVSLSYCAEPYAATHYTSTIRYNQLYYNEKDTTGITAQQLWVTPSFFDVFRNRGNDIAANEALKNNLNPQTIILSENAVEELTGGENPVGKKVMVGNDGDWRTVAALSVPVRWTEYFKSYPSFFIMLTETDIEISVNPNNLSDYELCVRITPGKETGFEDRFMTDMLEQSTVGNVYLMDVRSSSILRKAVVAPEESNIMLRSMLFIFIIVNIFLGVSGTFVFRTRHRKGEIGLRLALGSSKGDAGFLLVGEGLLLLTISFVLAILVNFNIGLAGLINLDWVGFTPIRFLAGTLVTYLIMVIMIITGIGYPAWLAMKTKPAEALKDND